MSFGSSTKTTQNSTQSTAIDPQLKARQDQVWQQANAAAQPYSPYTGQRFEGMNADQQNSFEAARRAAGAGQDTLNTAIGGANTLAGFNGQQVAAQQAGAYTAANPSQINAQMLGQSAIGGALTPQQVAAQQVAARSGAAGYEQYMNPYTNEVVNTSLSDIERARQEAANATRAQAAAAGAFGGSRSGVAESLTNRDFGNTAASTAAQLRQAGFNTALQYNAGDQNRELQAGMANQGAGLQAGIANQGAGLQAGAINQGNLLALQQGNQRTDLAAQQSNQAANAQNAQFNAGQLQQGDQFNANLNLQGQQSNQAAAAQAAGIRLGANSQLGGFAGQQQSMGAAGADLLNRIGGQQQAFGQQQRDFDYQQFLEGQQRPYQNASYLQGILGNQQYGTTQTGQSTSTQKNSQGAGSAILGAGLTVAGSGLIPGLGGAGAAPAPTFNAAPFNPQGGILDPNRPFGGY